MPYSLGLVAVLLGDGAINWIDMPEYEVHFHIVAALVRSKHDGVGCLVIELRNRPKQEIRGLFRGS